jgi:hypothetical protein
VSVPSKMRRCLPGVSRSGPGGWDSL